MSAGASHSKRRYRVVQWATGNIGTRSLRSVIEHPAMSLAGLYVHSEAKQGRDAGTFCGLGPVGVKATRSIDDILALDADCVLYMQQGCNFDDVCRILASGKNIVTTRTEFNNPASLAPELRQRVEAACAQGGASIHSTGASPGFVTEALPLVLTSLLRRLDGFRISEFANLAPRNSPELLFQVMGFGQAPDPRRDAGRAHHIREAFAPSLQLVAEALGLGFDAVEAHGEVALARRRTEIAAGVLEAGTVAAQRATVTGLYKGEKLMSFDANWYCGTDIDADWDLRSDGWRIEMAGDVPMAVDIRFPVSVEQWPLVSPGLTAHRAVNAVPCVCEAAPGIRTTVDLPQIISTLA
ncbi:dihydrodipicolinate reductase [Solimonas sp. K1W22B-7]|uniref:NAD(P)H-dependent amine dehydrogenase family protein n=1 Tax=Solimonas sp. K1W22B-7 TaxID=2303331 RepID=UPI000E3346E3|nr:dihydrodipicolinate reductase [Solimonas sp. K1W22B-7]AXQ28563.1 dihydrodipicolinate reductase [Solimonas sp. K1W22B-7]